MLLRMQKIPQFVINLKWINFSRNSEVAWEATYQQNFNHSLEEEAEALACQVVVVSAEKRRTRNR
jgi:hypothetical protein